MNDAHATPICADCQHYRPRAFDLPGCAAPQRTRWSPVRGSYHTTAECIMARTAPRDDCGIAGKWFIPRQRRAGPFQRLRAFFGRVL